MRAHIGLLFIGLICTGVCLPQNDSLADLLRAVEAKPGDTASLQKLIATLNELIQKNPNDRDLRFNLALAYFRSHEYARALANLQQIRPADPETENLKGDVYEHLARPLDAVQSFQRAAEQAPANEDFRFDYILQLLRHEAYPAAVLIAAPATKDFPQSQRVLLAYAVALFANGDFPLSASEATKAQNLNPDSELALYLMVLSDEAQHLTSAATARSVHDFLRRHRDDNLGYYLQAHLDFDGDRFNDAVRDLNSAVQRSPKNADILLLLGKSYEALGRNREALQSYRQAVGAEGNRAEAWYHLAKLAKTLGYGEESRIAFSKFRAAHDAQNGEVVRYLYALRQ